MRGRVALVTTQPAGVFHDIPAMPPRSAGDAPSRRARSSSWNVSSPSPLTTTSTSGKSRKTRSAWSLTCVPPKTTRPSGFSCRKVSANDPNARKFQPNTEQARTSGNPPANSVSAICAWLTRPRKLQMPISVRSRITGSASAIALT